MRLPGRHDDPVAKLGHRVRCPQAVCRVTIADRNLFLTTSACDFASSLRHRRGYGTVDDQFGDVAGAGAGGQQTVVGRGTVRPARRGRAGCDLSFERTQLSRVEQPRRRASPRPDSSPPQTVTKPRCRRLVCQTTSSSAGSAAAARWGLTRQRSGGGCSPENRAFVG